MKACPLLPPPSTKSSDSTATPPPPQQPPLSPPEYQTHLILIALFIPSFSFTVLNPAGLLALPIRPPRPSPVDPALSNGASDA